MNNEPINNEKYLRKSLFIIIKGSVNILYDGEFFGDFSNEFGWNFCSKPGLLNIEDPYFETCEESYFIVIPLEI